MMMSRPSRFLPIKVGEELNVRIEAVGEKGDGICKKQGFVLFVPNTKEGDTVKIKVTKVLRKVGFAEVIGPADGPVEGEGSQSESRKKEYQQPQKKEPAPADSDDFGEEETSEDDENN